MPSVNLLSPSGVKLRAIVGAGKDEDFTTVFAIGDDGNLWGRVYFAAQWLPWTLIGHPPSGKLVSSENDLGHAVVASGKGAWWIFCVNAAGTVSVAMKADRNALAWTWTDIPGCPGEKRMGALLGAEVERVSQELHVDCRSVREPNNMVYYANAIWNPATLRWTWRYWMTGHRPGGFYGSRAGGIGTNQVVFGLQPDGTVVAMPMGR